MEKEKTIIKTIALPESIYKRLQIEAEKDFRNETAEIRYIITKYLNEVDSINVNNSVEIQSNL